MQAYILLMMLMMLPACAGVCSELVDLKVGSPYYKGVAIFWRHIQVNTTNSHGWLRAHLLWVFSNQQTTHKHIYICTYVMRVYRFVTCINGCVYEYANQILLVTTKIQRSVNACATS